MGTRTTTPTGQTPARCDRRFGARGSFDEVSDDLHSNWLDWDVNLTHRPPLADVALEATIATKQDPEKATPLFATNLLDRLSVSVSGDGGHIRDLEDWWRLLTEAGASERLDV